MARTLATPQRRQLVERPALLAALSTVAPWAALAVRGERSRAVGAALADTALVAAAVTAVWRGRQLTGDPWHLVAALAATAVVAAGARAATAWGSVADAGWHAARGGRPARVWPGRVLAATATVACAAVMAAAGAVAWTYVQLDQVFADHEAATAVPEPVDAAAPGTTGWVPPGAGTGRTNVLLVGTDAGAGRRGARTDSMNLVSVDGATGDAWVVGIPRNLQRAPMPAKLAAQFPDGFDDLLNAVWGWAEAHPGQAVDPDDPGGSTLKAVVANLTGQKVDYLVTVRMQGLDQVVDAIGGVDVDNLRAAPLTPLDDDPRPVPKVLPTGVQHLDGPLAVAYARSRRGDSDYERMARQRCVLEAVLKKARTPSVLGRYPALVAQLAGWVRTDAPRSATDRLASAFSRVDPAKVRVLSLVPPAVDVRRPDVAQVRALVAQLAAPAAAPAAGTPGVHGGTLVDGPDSASLRPAAPGSTSTSTTVAAGRAASVVQSGAASAVCRTP